MDTIGETNQLDAFIIKLANDKYANIEHDQGSHNFVYGQDFPLYATIFATLDEALEAYKDMSKHFVHGAYSQYGDLGSSLQYHGQCVEPKGIVKIANVQLEKVSI